ncbi:MAG: ABC transporter permease [Tetrasphaera sp.]
MTAVLDPVTSHLTHDRQSVAQVRGIPLPRLCRVELRKMVDTRAGRWMLIVMSAISLLVAGINLIWGSAQDQAFGTYLGLTSLPLMILLPIVGIMAATAEWSQRTGLVTFTLEPRRGRVVGAKVVAGVALGLVVVAAAFAAAALAQLIAIVVRDVSGDWEMPWKVVLGFVIAMTVFVIQGLAFGFSLLNTAVAIVASILLPTVWSIVSGLSERLNSVAAWLDLNRTIEPMMSGTLTGEQWAQLGTSSAVWIGIPLAIGTWRVLTREVK